MTDIAARLRERGAIMMHGAAIGGPLMVEAADEIERLRAEQANLRAALDHWFEMVPRADRAQFPFTGQVP
jgi:hypothetical protein